MSIGTYFKGNFGILATEYDESTMTYIYDYAIFKATQMNRNLIIVCTSFEKEDKWKKISGAYDFKPLIIVREACEGFIYLTWINNFYLDAVHVQNIVIIDGAYDLMYGKQTLAALPIEEVKKRYSDWLLPIKDWDKFIADRVEVSYADPKEILDIMDDCPENMILLIAECKRVSIEELKSSYSELIDYGDAIIGIVNKNTYVDAIPLIEHKKTLHDIKEDMRFEMELNKGSIVNVPYSVRL